ncbi:MAG: ABC transporter ATP-binding protein/permease, partial [Lachnospiraceae bacterium]|nr:ABC transporter ATP-binding protein/permease [Lachnospiraceae bacterium]
MKTERESKEKPEIKSGRKSEMESLQNAEIEPETGAAKKSTQKQKPEPIPEQKTEPKPEPEPKQKPKQKPKYNMWQNTAYYIAFAWKEKEKKVIFLSILLACFAIFNHLVNLYVSPTILSVVEKREPVPKLLLTIFCFTGAMMLCSAVLAYVNANLPYGKITVRTAVLEHINRKTMMTSYPNVNDDAFIKLVAKCQTVTNDNICATEAIWGTLSELLQDGVCFILWLLLLSNVDLRMIAVVFVTSVIGYFVNRYVSGYEYRHRDELSGYEKRLWYVSSRAGDYSAAKDIRIFGMRPWLAQLGERAMAAYMAFRNRAEGVYAWGRIADLILAFLRNGIAYLYLIRLVVLGEITAAQFLLYFSAVGGFTMWVCGILGNLARLYQQCLDISTVRECLEYPECFRFEDGERLKPDSNAEYEIRLENVSFRYPGAEKETLSKINLTLHPGEKLAI